MPFQPFMGQIMPIAFDWAPKGWALCNGALIAINSNQALFSLLGTYYGGDGIRTFGLPDLRGRAILGSTGQTGNYPAGMTSGQAAVTLTTQQIPLHLHGITASTTAVTSRVAVPPTGNIFAVNTTPPRDIFLLAGSDETNLALGTNIVPDGGNQPHNNMQPYLTINYVIATQGIYPSRN